LPFHDERDWNNFPEKEMNKQEADDVMESSCNLLQEKSRTAQDGAV